MAVDDEENATATAPDHASASATSGREPPTSRSSAASLAELHAERLAGPTQAALDRALRQLGQLGDLGGRLLFPVVQLDHDLQVDRQSPQRLAHRHGHARASEPAGVRGADRRDRDLLEVVVDVTRVPSQRAQVIVQAAAGDLEQIHAERTAVEHLLAVAQARDERLLHEVVGGVADLVDEEAVEHREGAPQQQVAGAIGARLPLLEQLDLRARLALHRRISVALDRPALQR
ncbi:MAG: hypothetical protein U0168_22105 [Nannocystaceae bacterium]